MRSQGDAPGVIQRVSKLKDRETIWIPTFTSSVPSTSLREYQLAREKRESFGEIPYPSSTRAYAVTTEEVTSGSSARRKKAVAALALFFKREFGYDFLQYSESESDPNSRVFLWSTDSFGSRRCYGAVSFRLRVYKDHQPVWALQWVWIHPYHRGEGWLTSIWPYLIKRFGAFDIEPPLSKAMQRFLTKHERPAGFPLDLGNAISPKAMKFSPADAATYPKNPLQCNDICASEMPSQDCSAPETVPLARFR